MNIYRCAMAITMLVLIGTGPCANLRAEELVGKGLILDLDAEQGITLNDDGRVKSWANQARSKAKNFVATRDSRHKNGTGCPVLEKQLASISGHNAVSFKRHELINSDEDAFDHLTMGSGYTWLVVISVDRQVPGLKDVNSIFGNLRNGSQHEGFWAGLNDDNGVWIGSRNGRTFGRWNEDNPKVQGPVLKKNRFYIIAGRMGAGRKKVLIELFIDTTKAVASKPFIVNPKSNPSKMAIGQERDATNHPGKESFDGRIAKMLMYERPLSDQELADTLALLKKRYSIK
jgi:hypothetical protein